MRTSYLRWRHTRRSSVAADFAAVERLARGVPARDRDGGRIARAGRRRRLGCKAPRRGARDRRRSRGSPRSTAAYAQRSTNRRPRRPLDGNLLRDGRVSGVVDWEAGAVGRAGAGRRALRPDVRVVPRPAHASGPTGCGAPRPPGRRTGARPSSTRSTAPVGSRTSSEASCGRNSYGSAPRRRLARHGARRRRRGRGACRRRRVRAAPPRALRRSRPARGGR